MDQQFKTELAAHTFYNKYALTQDETWHQRAITIVDFICGTAGGNIRAILSEEERQFLIKKISEFKFMPGGRYIYYAGRKARYYNNCYLFRGLEDTKEEWASLNERVTSSLMTGGGIGIDYSIFRPSGRLLRHTGGQASGPIPLMSMINEIGRNVMQGGSRRSAIYASLNWMHEDVERFLAVKNWKEKIIGPNDYSVWDAKQFDFNFPGELDMTNISLNYDDTFLRQRDEALRTGGPLPEVFMQNVRQALSTGEPGFSFNFGDKENETLRNACGEVVSEDDSDVCNLGSVNIGAIENIEEFKEIVRVASKFLVCGTLRAALPSKKIKEVREKNRRLGLGLMGIHEWLLKRRSQYEVTPELKEWLEVYRDESEAGADEHCDRLYLSRPAGYRAIAPTGTIGIIAGTTTGIEPLYAVAYKRRYLIEGDKWKYEFVVDRTAQILISEYGLKPEDIDTALQLAKTPEKRIAFQADVQEYVDMAISSTINLPEWGTKYNNEGGVDKFAKILAKYAHRLRGFTCYPDSSRGGQPLTVISYEEAMAHKGTVFDDNDSCKGGKCGL